jgi:hypothetical protein
MIHKMIPQNQLAPANDANTTMLHLLCRSAGHADGK